VHSTWLHPSCAVRAVSTIALRLLDRTVGAAATCLWFGAMLASLLSQMSLLVCDASIAVVRVRMHVMQTDTLLTCLSNGCGACCHCC